MGFSFVTEIVTTLNYYATYYFLNIYYLIYSYSNSMKRWLLDPARTPTQQCDWVGGLSVQPVANRLDQPKNIFN